MSDSHPSRWMAACFFASGFTALLYQTVWMRLALARFGVNSSVIATVLAVFMTGLAVGTVLSGRFAAPLEERFGVHGLRLYGVAELIVGVGGVAVPFLFDAARNTMLSLGSSNGTIYYLVSTTCIAVVLLPFCTAMGLTFPTAVSFLRRVMPVSAHGRFFSGLYLANVCGALLGAVVTPLVLIEEFGFLATTLGAACGNLLIAMFAFTAYRRASIQRADIPSVSAEAAAPRDAAAVTRDRALFLTGFSTMGFEVLWTRIYPPFIGTLIYSFAAIVSSYLVATTIGTLVYRRVRGSESWNRASTLWPWLCVASLLPLLTASVSFVMSAPLRVFVGVAPFCALLGFITPALVDAASADRPSGVGRSYGINLLGCLLGPLAAGFILIPAFGNRIAALCLAVPLFSLLYTGPIRRDVRTWSLVVTPLVGVALLFSPVLFEDRFPAAQVKTDNSATVVAKAGPKLLFVNGVGMTGLTPVTKLMAHFPAAHLSSSQGRPLRALVICFGMGATFRSLMSWDADVTAVELIPSVPSFFGFYFPDGPEMIAASHGKARIIVDDGRRYLDRVPASYDLITIDPPPPVAAAGSSLLYSREFYDSAKRRMAPGAILQAWLPGGDRRTVAAVTLALLESFSYVRTFRSVASGGGYHYLASMTPIPKLAAAELLSRMPSRAIRDMVEFEPVEPASYFATMLASEVPPETYLVDGSRTASQVLSDDRPVNEYYFIRRYVTHSE